MSSFTDPLDLRYDAVANNWTVLRGFEYHVGMYPSNEVIRVPKGFKTDLASVPFGFRWLIPMSGEYNQAAVLHDWMCVNFYDTHKRRCEIFAEAMTVLGVPDWKRKLMTTAVRIGGPRNPR